MLDSWKSSCGVFRDLRCCIGREQKLLSCSKERNFSKWLLNCCDCRRKRPALYATKTTEKEQTSKLIINGSVRARLCLADGPHKMGVPRNMLSCRVRQVDEVRLKRFHLRGSRSPRLLIHAFKADNTITPKARCCL